MAEYPRHCHGSGWKIELGADGALDRQHVLATDPADSFAQAKLADRAQLIGHRLPLLSANTDIRLGRIKARNIAR
jgi:hypothetical protein